MGFGFLCVQMNPCHLRPCAQTWKGGSLRPGAIFRNIILRGSAGSVTSLLGFGVALFLL